MDMNRGLAFFKKVKPVTNIGDTVRFNELKDAHGGSRASTGVSGQFTAQTASGRIRVHTALQAFLH